MTIDMPVASNTHDPELIGLAGRKQSGKSTVEELLAARGYRSIAYGDVLKRLVRNLFDVRTDVLWGSSETRDRTPVTIYGSAHLRADQNRGWIIGHFGAEIPKATGDEIIASLHRMIDHLAATPNLTARGVLQQIGTEWGRANDPDVWVRHTLTLADYLANGFDYAPKLGAIDPHGGDVASAAPLVDPFRTPLRLIEPRRVVVTDVRFVNEALPIRERGTHALGFGKVWWLDIEKRVPRTDKHSSEPRPETFTGIASWFIDNNGPLENLPAQVQRALRFDR